MLNVGLHPVIFILLTVRGHFQINCNVMYMYRVKSGKFGPHVNLDTHFQTVEIQMRRLLMNRLIRIFTVCLVSLFFIPIIEL